jgi:hypothetical protein
MGLNLAIPNVTHQPAITSTNHDGISAWIQTPGGWENYAFIEIQ